MSLTTKQKQQFKAQAHHLKPVVLLGNLGLTPAVHEEIERALNDHELIKIRVPAGDKEGRQELISNICSQHNADLVQSIGRVLVVYRRRVNFL